MILAGDLAGQCEIAVRLFIPECSIAEQVQDYSNVCTIWCVANFQFCISYITMV